MRYLDMSPYRPYRVMGRSCRTRPIQEKIVRWVQPPPRETPDGRFVGRPLARADIEAAAVILARALANACRLLFPSRILISGPFAANAALFARFDALFRREGAMAGLTMPALTVVRASSAIEIEGAAAALLDRSIRAALSDAAISA